MPITLDGTNGITQAGEFNSDSTFGFKNRIINGAMVIDQRNAGASVTQTTSTIYTLDRWNCYGAVASKFTVQQSSTAPVGFVNSALITSSSAYSVGSGEIFQFVQPIEGYNVADLNWGSANAKTVTLSFWVRSSLTGTFGGAVQNSASNRSYPFTYTVSAANTFEYKTITIAGDTSGTWLTTNGVGMYLYFGLGVGSTYSGTAGAWAGSDLHSATGATSVVGTNGATFYITGVQLEVGSTATSFDYRPYSTEQSLCYRYFQKYGGNSVYELMPWSGLSYGVNGTEGPFIFRQIMRTAPSISFSAAGDFKIYEVSNPTVTSINMDMVGPLTARVAFNCSGGLTTGNSAYVFTNNTTSAFISFSSEL